MPQIMEMQSVFTLFVLSASLGIFAQRIPAGNLLNLEAYEQFAFENLPPAQRDFLQGGAGFDDTVKRNTATFAKWRVLPRYLRDVSNRTTETTILDGWKFSMPVGLSPTGMQSKYMADAEILSARAAAAAGTVMILSAVSNVPLEDVRKGSPDATLWQQVVLYKNLSITEDMARRAEKANFSALVLTVDYPVGSLRYQNQRNNYKGMYGMRNIDSYVATNGADDLDQSCPSWGKLRHLVEFTKLPVLVKGIQTAADARLVHKSGARGIIVSNHGGRQLDGGLASIEALALIVKEFPEAERPGFEIFMDGGVRSGVDVFRALALGAKFVFVGRPQCWGVAYNGQQGVEHVLELFRHEFNTVMGQAGVTRVEEITPDYVTLMPQCV